MATIDMPRLGAILDRESYEWLAAAHPDILAAIEAEVAAARSWRPGGWLTCWYVRAVVGAGGLQRVSGR